MRTVRRLLYGDVIWSVAFVAVAFLSLFFFIDFVDELGAVGREGYTLWQATLRVLLEQPGHFYELFPIAVLIGTIYSMARLAQSSEFTILRTGGLGPARALGLLAALGLVFAAITFLIGEYVTPFAEERAAVVKAGMRGGLAVGEAGAWLKERRDTPEGERSVSINVGGASAGGALQRITIFEFDERGQLRERIAADSASVDKQAVWHLKNVHITRWPTTDDSGTVSTTQQDTLAWASRLPASVIAAAVLPIGTMSTLDLWRYSQHLADQEQAAQRYEIQFWKRALYPFACLVMVALALPFAYLHARAGGVSVKVFGGILLGISFVLLNNLAGHLGMLRDWQPWLVAAVPSAAYLLLSMAAFTWLVRHR